MQRLDRKKYAPCTGIASVAFRFVLVEGYPVVRPITYPSPDPVGVANVVYSGPLGPAKSTKGLEAACVFG